MRETHVNGALSISKQDLAIGDGLFDLPSIVDFALEHTLPTNR
jgi:hypothetical protein